MRDQTSPARDPQALLRRALLVDAVATAGMGALLAAAPGLLDGLLGLPVALLRGAGLALLPFAALLAWVARRPRIPAGLAWTLVIVNVLWAIDSVVLPLTGWIDPTALGAAFVVAQGLIVAAFAWVEWTGAPTRDAGRGVTSASDRLRCVVRGRCARPASVNEGYGCSG